MTILAMVRLKANQAFVFVNEKLLPTSGGAAVFAHLDEHLVSVVEYHLGDRELPVLGIENDHNLGNVGVLRHGVGLVESVGTFALRTRAVRKSHAETVEIVFKPLQLGYLKAMDGNG
jgi:hypothetical protein